MAVQLKLMRDPITKTVRYFSEGVELLLTDVLEGRLFQKAKESMVEVSDGSRRSLVLHDAKHLELVEDYLGEFVDTKQKNEPTQEAYPDDVLDYLGVADYMSPLIKLKQKVTTIARSKKEGRVAYTVYNHKDKAVSFVDEDSAMLTLHDVRKHYPAVTLQSLSDSYGAFLVKDDATLRPSVLRVEPDKRGLKAYRIDKDAKNYQAQQGVLVATEELDDFEAKVHRKGRVSLAFDLAKPKQKDVENTKPAFVREAFLDNLRRTVREHEEQNMYKNKTTKRKIVSKPDTSEDYDDALVF